MDAYSGDEPIQLVFHTDNHTPAEFVAELLCSVFGKTERDAGAFISRIRERGKAACGPYPPLVAGALVETAQQQIRAAGHPLLITSERASATEETEDEEFEYACDALYWYFDGLPQTRLVTAVRQFPGHMRADVQAAVDKLFASPIQFFGIHEEYRYETTTFARLMKSGRNAQALAPPQYVDVDVGENAAARCLHNGLWLCQAGEL